MSVVVIWKIMASTHLLPVFDQCIIEDALHHLHTSDNLGFRDAGVYFLDCVCCLDKNLLRSQWYKATAFSESKQGVAQCIGNKHASIKDGSVH